MRRHWGNLRKLIDLGIVKDMETHQDPPFPLSIVTLILMKIARGMAKLHREGILHKDLKAANVLLNQYASDYIREG